MPHAIRSIFAGAAVIPVLLLSPACAQTAPENGFVSVFDGKTLDGWHTTAKSWHSSTSGHQSAGMWRVEDGAIVGGQDEPGNGGILLTDSVYRDVEVSLEMRNDFGLDSGLYLRSTEEGEAYQATIDYHGAGTLMGVYGEALRGTPSAGTFSFAGAPDKIVPREGAYPLAIEVEQWDDLWNHGEWNELRARIVGNPPTITTWINGVKWLEWTDPEMRHVDEGMIGLQVHGGGDHKELVRYRNIRVKRL